MPEAQLQLAVGILGVGQRNPRDFLFVGIVVEIDVLTAQHTPIEAAVLNLVLAEGAVLRRQWRRQDED